MAQQTLPQLLLERSKKEGDKVAFRQKDLGIWNEWSWSDYYSAVQSFGLGIQKKFSIEKYEKVGIIGDNRPQWVITELAVQSIGAVPVGIYQDATPIQTSYYIEASKVQLLIVEDQEQVDKVLEVLDTLPQIKGIIYYNDKGLRNYPHPKLFHFKDVQAIGQELVEQSSQLLENQIKEINSSDIAFISFTSGANGHSKAAQFSHNNLIQTAESMSKMDSINEKDDYLSFLSLAWICEQVIAVGLSLTEGLTINFPEEPSTILTDLREIGPHIIQAPPRTYENILARFHVRMNDSTKLKKKVYTLFEPLIDQKAGMKLNEQSVSSFSKAYYLLGDFIVFSAIRDHLGLSRVKRAYVTGGSLNPEALKFFQGMGVNVKQTYGAVETTGYSAIQEDGKVSTTTSGKALPNTTITLTSKGELEVRGSNVFAGYLNEDNPENFFTGDYGQVLENGEVTVGGRFADLITLESGQLISPNEVEGHLKSSPYIQEAVIVGDKKSYVTALISINRASTGRWAEKKQITYKNFRDLATNLEVTQLIREEVGKIVKTLPQDSKIRRFVILPEEFDGSEGELTPTQKVVRHKVIEMYTPYINALYDASVGHQFEEPDIFNFEDRSVQVISLETSQGVVAG